MARETRRQRRDQRKSSGAPKPAAAQRTRSQPQQVRPGMQPSSTQTGRRERQRGRFVRESWAELKKVEWPTQNQVIQGTIVVIIACAIVGAYLWLADLAFKPFVRDILLR